MTFEEWQEKVPKLSPQEALAPETRVVVLSLTLPQLSWLGLEGAALKRSTTVLAGLEDLLLCEILAPLAALGVDVREFLHAV